MTATLHQPGESQRRAALGRWAWFAAALLLAALAVLTNGAARFALLDRFATPNPPVLVLPGKVLVLAGALAAVAAGWLRRGWASGLGAAGLLLGLTGWAAAGAPVEFLVANQLAGTLGYATPLVLGALGGLLCERAGVINIAIEGQFLAAAFAAATAGAMASSIGAGLLAGVAAGVGVGALLAWLSINRGVGQVVVGIVLNLLIAGLTGFWLTQFLIPQQLRAPVLGRVPLAWAAALAVAGVWVVVQRTKWGLRLRAVGEQPLAAEAAGIRVARVQWQAVLTGGLLAGLGGCFFTLAGTGQFTRGISAGYGFVALAALIMGRWRPLPTAAAALGFGFVLQLAAQFQGLGTPLPSQLLLIAPYLVTIVVVAAIARPLPG